jgi:hypothetical protein
MPNNATTVEIYEGETSFMLCLVLGTLVAVKAGAVSTELGIWSLGRPKLLDAISRLPNVPEALSHALAVADELDAIRKIDPDHLNELLDELISGLTDAFAQIQNQVWHANLTGLRSSAD